MFDLIVFLKLMNFFYYGQMIRDAQSLAPLDTESVISNSYVNLNISAFFYIVSAGRGLAAGRFPI
jgi:hypothetical protein